MTEKGTRIYYLEVLRAVAALAVVALHLSSVNWYGYIGSFNWIVFTVIAGTMRFCVPIFFMISGALFLRRDKEVPIRKMYRKNIFRMIVFLIFWAFLYQIYQLYTGQAEGNMVLTAVKNIIKGDVSVHLWFVYAIIGIYILIPVLKVFTDHADKRQLIYFLVIIFVMIGIVPVMRQSSWIGIRIILTNFDKLCFGSMGSYIGYVLLGHYLYTYDFSKRGRYVVYAAGIAGVIFTILITIYRCVSGNTCDETYFNYVMPNVALWSMAVFVFFKNACAQEGRMAGLVGYLSDISLGIYGIHLLIIFFLQNLGLSTLSFNALLSVPVLYILVMVISMVIVSLLKKVPLLRKYVC